MKRLQEIDAGVLVGLFGPLAGYLVYWKLQRLQMLPGSPGWGLLDLLRPELLLHASILCAFFGLLARFAHRPRPVRAALALTYLGLGGLEFLCHSHFTTSGAAMDAGLFAYALTNLEGMSAAFGELGGLALTVGAGVLLAPLPWILSRPAPMEPAPDGLRFVSLAALPALLSLLPPLSDTVPKSVGRHSVSHLLVTLWSREPTVTATRPWAQSAITGEAMYNLVFVSLESVRFQSTSLFDTSIDTTPTLAGLRARSVTATHAYATMPHSTKATVPMLCGVPPDPVLAIHESRALPVDCLPRQLRERGYRTAHFRSATEHFENWRGLSDELGFEDFVPPEEMDTDGFEKANYFGYEDDIMLEPARSWLRESEEPFFAFFLAGTPHHDYAVPAREGEERSWHEDPLMDGYLRSIHYTDGFVDRLLRLLEDEGRLDNTVVLIVGDHGEGFGEHLPRQHNTNPYEEGLRVPLLLFGPGIEPALVEEPVSHLDLLPTLVEALGARLDGEVIGHSLLRPLPQRTVYASCWYNARCLASWRGRDKHIHHFGDLPVQRFDLDADPAERAPLPADPQAAEDLLGWYLDTRARWEASRSPL